MSIRRRIVMIVGHPRPYLTLARCLSALLLAAPASTALAQDRCESQQLDLTRVQPSIWMVIDGSGSMLEPLSTRDDTPRWTALRDAVLGAVEEHPRDVKWAVALYDGPLPDGSDKGSIACPRVVLQEPQPDNLAAITAAYPADPLGGSTPTDRALAAVRARVPDPQSSPQVVVLVTDGQPNDFCTTGAPVSDVQARVLSEVEQLHARGAAVYVISLAGADTALNTHLAALAAAGGTGLPPFAPQTTDELQESLEDITGPRVSCRIPLSAPVDAQAACLGKVSLNGVALACHDRDGFRVRKGSQLELRGRACKTYRGDPTAELHAEFPCAMSAGQAVRM
jgi:hypothetical protein